MARRTKEDALATRQSLLDAAELLFQAQGVSRTSLNDIAKQAGTSRGAIYWHFKDKADLFNAMMERVTLPLEQSFDDVMRDAQTDPLARICHGIRQALLHIATDPHTRRVFEVATHKVEYVDELQAVRLRHLTVRHEFLQQVESGLLDAAERQALTLTAPASTVAQGLHAIIDGLIQNWLLDSTAFDLAAVGQDVVDIYLAGLGFKPEKK
ncbi:TetR family transcriptional regulator [Polaromonas sp. SM01]|uniref:TetR family transcriptional regulator n=1 Tax=Polaromonas sp. SM01 TaxID=3085630 RepID=UPI0029810540|nr:TetR family transcriptional regulator [Polaromonas sp. SM01]MDW5443133.1 TetR family transcriptional regulator [Polaromonas sp. SM01]